MTKVIRNQSGFSLIELLIALGLLTLLAVGLQSAFDGSRSRAQALIDQMSTLGDAAARFQNDTGCFPLNVPVLFTQTLAATATTNTCNKSVATTWNGPYLQPTTVGAVSSQIAIDKVTDGAQLGISSAVGGIGRRYIAVASGLTADVAIQFLQECNGVSSTTAGQTGVTPATVSYKCGSASTITSGATNVSVFRIIAETR